MRPAALSTLLLLGLAAPALAADKPLWDYLSGALDDEDWEKLSPDYETCLDGQEQSPVAIGDTKKIALEPLVFDYKQSDVVVQRRELTLIVQFWGTSKLVSEGEDYFLKQIRFHSPAEHDVKDTTLPLEMHFIHQTAEGKVIIVAVQADVGKSNEAMQAIVEHLPGRGVPEQKMQMNPSGLLPKTGGQYVYYGSLSWPPCTEGVQWRVMKSPITISKEQLKAIEHLLGRNARLPKALNGRTILETIE